MSRISATGEKGTTGIEVLKKVYMGLHFWSGHKYMLDFGVNEDNVAPQLIYHPTGHRRDRWDQTDWLQKYGVYISSVGAYSPGRGRGHA